MADFGIIRLDWSVDRRGYDLAEIPERAASTLLMGRLAPGLYVKPRGGDLNDYTAHLREKDIFLDLARMERSSDGVLAFVHKWGLLDAWPRDAAVREIIWASETMEHLLNVVKKGGNALAQIGRERWHFRLDGEFRGSDVIVRVKSLKAFCWLEFRQAHLAGGDFYRCANPKCADWRRYPATGRPNKFCSEACKKAAQRARKKNETAIHS